MCKLNQKYLLEVKDLKKYYPIGKNFWGKSKSIVKAVNGVSLTISKGETVGLVGESGCGKSTLGRCILKLEEATAGNVVFQGHDMLHMSGEKLKKARRSMQPIFQDPFASLNPRKTVRQILLDPYKVHNLYTLSERLKHIEKLLQLVGLRKEHADRYPHEFSGGQRQRIAIARALTLQPSLIIADEAVSALDVSIQAQILNLMVDLQNQLGLAYLFISHDLSVVRHISDRVAVMYLGQIVELAPTKELYSNPQHPYTTALLAAAPTADPEKRQSRAILTGDLQAFNDVEQKCAFWGRCQKRKPDCEDHNILELKHIGGGHYVACCGLDE